MRALLSNRELLISRSSVYAGAYPKSWRHASRHGLRSSIKRLFTCEVRKPNSHRSKLPDAPARTRFAPSPTGFLHLGSLRTALFNYLLARATSGQFLLRLEDTDAKRTVDTAEARLYEDLRWAGLQWDEGPLVGGPHGPYRQSERTAIYHEHAQQLLETPHAYRCFCSVERLDELSRRRQALGLPTDYDRLCASLSRGESDDRADRGEKYVVRLKVPKQYPEFRDMVYGKIGKDQSGGGGGANAGITVKYGEIAYEDPVLLKSDGHPTYHFANVVDDHLMRITHVVRATEWISSTPKHLALYQAFGWRPPQYAHVGLLVDAEGRKLSKRNFDTDVGSYRDRGLLPEAMVNFAALLGWSHGRKSDVMDLAELVRQFQTKFTKGNTIVTDDKLWFLQRHHASRAAASQSSSLREAMVPALIKGVRALLSDADGGTAPQSNLQHRIHDIGLQEYARRLLTIDARSYETPAAFAERNDLFFRDPDSIAMPPPFDASSEVARSSFSAAEALLDCSHVVFRHRDPTASATFLDAAIKAVAAGSVSGHARCEELIRVLLDGGQGPSIPALSDSEKEAYKYLCKWIRHILFMSKPGPNLGSAMELLGPGVCKERVQRFVDGRNV